MRLLFLPKGAKTATGEKFPLMEVPLSGEGAEKTELNDFQWWAPTDKWQEWLKKNPRTWKAESEVFDRDEIYDMVLEFLTPGGESSSVMGFDDFQEIFEDEENENSDSPISTEEANKRYTKLTFAYNKLNKEKKIKSPLDFSTVTPNNFLSIFLDLSDEKGNVVPESRNAYKLKVFPTSESSKFYMAQLTETALTGPIPEDQPIQVTFKQAASIAGQVVVSGGLAIIGISFVISTIKYVAASKNFSRVMKGIIPGYMKAIGKGIGSVFSPISRLFKGAKYFVTSIGGIRPFLFGAKTAAATASGFFKELRATKNVISAFTAGRRAAVVARGGANVAKGSNPVGWAITALTVGQHMYNWFSSNQAPRFGEIEDDGIGAQNSFSPGSIPDGQNITVCWTQEAGSGFLSFLASLVINNDTRTTMEIVKLGNFGGKAVFYLVDVHSESYKKLLQENSMILLFFNEGAKFEHGVLDNDDLELEVLSIKDSSGLAGISFFQGYCSWDEFKSTFDGADDKALAVSENAPDEYSFHFKYGKGSRDINVTGKLVKDLSSIESVKKTFDTGQSEENSESSNESYSFDTSPEVMSFFEFSSGNFSSSFSLLEEETIPVDKIEETDFTETQRVAPYLVDKIEYADKTFEGQELPDLLSFMVPPKFLEAEDNQSIKIEPIQDIAVKTPVKGTIVIETREVPEPVPVEIVGATGTSGEEEIISTTDSEVEGGVPVEVTKGEVKIKHRDNPEILNDLGIPDVTKIKDKDKDDKIKFLDFITPEEKEELGMQDWDFIKKVKIAKDGSGNPISIRFKSGGIGPERKKKKFKSSDSNFDVALKVADRILAGFKEAEDKEED